jgi:prepilin-type N-terminal cleavage/methylation domain-containing protein
MNIIDNTKGKSNFLGNIVMVNQKGFTLSEFLIVVAILGLLSAVVIPNVGRFTAKSRESLICIVYSLEQGEQKVIDQFSIGIIDIWHPDKMRIGDSQEVVIVLTPSQEVSNITTDTYYQPNSVDNYIKVSDKTIMSPIMAAELYCVNFDVSTKPNNLREVSLDTETKWSWIITPKVVGEQVLSIELTAPAETQGFEDIVTTATYSRSFNMSIVKSFDWASLWKSYMWQAIIVIIGVLGALFLLIRRIRRRKSQPEELVNTDTSENDE